MASNLILSVQEGAISFGEKVIFDDLTFNIHAGDKICLVGKNGSGKSTLMNVITGDRELDSGERWILQGTKVGYLRQDVIPQEGQTVYDYVFEQLKKDGAEEENRWKVEMVIQPLELHPEDKMTKLSGGQLRRASLARALVEEPDILMLDEPTNHLDLDVIEWLENFLRYYPGAVLCVSHDKTFLENISDKIFWLDRGRMRVCPKGFRHFDDWSGTLLEQEERELANRKKALEIEVDWASRGVKARRKRNQRRLEKMKDEREKLKKDAGAFRRLMRRIEIDPLDETALGSHVVAEFFKTHKKFEEDGRENIILNNFNFRIMRGDRIGILGKNGSGKTTFLRMLIGETKPDMGKAKLARDLEFSYFDQKRRDLKYTDTVQQALCPNGGDYIKVMGKVRHVCGYMKDFMFDPGLAAQKVGTLSGGQKNRLLLAKVLADPKSLMILDEPTNDLDMDTLDMLEEILSQYNGTLIVVSHDRDFLDQTVSKILAFEGGGMIDGCVGGYSDWLEYKKRRDKEDEEIEEVVRRPREGGDPSRRENAPQPARERQKKLTYKLQYELDNLPDRIETYKQEIADAERTLDDAELYVRNKGEFESASKRLAAARMALEQAELRWLELEEMRAAP